MISVECPVLHECVSFATGSSPCFFWALIEQFLYSAHQNPERYVVVEPAFPQVTNELNDLGEGERGDIVDVITFSFAAGRCIYDEGDL
jgi:hypothetical protein